jgi:hypothetical protein
MELYLGRFKYPVPVVIYHGFRTGAVKDHRSFESEESVSVCMLQWQQSHIHRSGTESLASEVF